MTSGTRVFRCDILTMSPILNGKCCFDFCLGRLGLYTYLQRGFKIHVDPQIRLIIIVHVLRCNVIQGSVRCGIVGGYEFLKNINISICSFLCEISIKHPFQGFYTSFSVVSLSLITGYVVVNSFCFQVLLKEIIAELLSRISP